MKRRPKVDDDDGGGLDSLLDTMTNVVGILVMVLIATQLGVKDAVSRIADAEVVDAAAMEQAKEKLLLTEQQRDAVAAKLEELKPIDDSAVKVQLADLRRKLDETRTNLNQESAVTNQFALKIETDKQKADAANKQMQEMENSKEKREELQTELTKALEDEAKMKAILDDTPQQQAPPPKIVTLPDPRPAPEGARAVVFLCTNNRVYPIAADDIRDPIRKKVEYIVETKRLDGGPEVGVNEEKFMTEFKKQFRRLYDDFFDVEIYASGIYPRLKFIPKEGAGADIDEVLRPRSRFQKALLLLDRSKYYVRYIVLPDSYEVYIAARSVSDRAELLSGWDPQGEGWEFTTHVGGSTLFGPKPPPNPNPPATPPAKPANVID